MSFRQFLTASILLCSSTLFAVEPGHFSAAVQSASGGDNPISVEVGDFNRDGRSDVAVIHFADRRLTILTGNGDGTFSLANTYELDPEPRESVVTDFNGDGFLDLAVANSAAPMSVAMFLGNGNGSFRSPVSHVTEVVPFGIAAGDLNGDGKSDLVVASNFSGRVLLGAGDGSFTESAQSIPGIEFSVALGDVDQDDNLDVVGGDWLSVTVARGNGDGTLQPPVRYDVGGGGVIGVALADLNADGVLDISATDFNESAIAVLLGTTGGSFQPAVRYPLVPQPLGLHVVDVAGNSAADIITINSGSAEALIHAGPGDGTFAPLRFIRMVAPSVNLAIQDFDGDGLTDILATHPELDSVAAYLNGASGTSIALTTSAPITETGETVTFTAKVTAAEPSTTIPDGKVAFYANDTIIGEALLDSTGETSFSTSSLPLGEVKVRARYQGTRRFSPATSAPALTQITNGDPCDSVAAVPAVTICTPTDGSVVSGAVRILASARSNHTVTAVKVYIDNQQAFSTAARVVDFSRVLDAGPHKITVQAWDSSGAVFKSSVQIGFRTFRRDAS